MAVIDKVKVLLPFVLLGLGAFLGYQYAASHYEKEIAEIKRAQSQAINNAQVSYKTEYEKREKALIASYLADRDRQLERMRNLESKLHARSNVAAVARERSQCLRLVAEGAGLVEEGRRIIEAERGSVEKK